MTDHDAKVGTDPAVLGTGLEALGIPLGSGADQM